MNDPEDQPMYYENKFEGEWQCQKKDRKGERYCEYQFAAFVTAILVSLGILSVIGYYYPVPSDYRDYLVRPFAGVILLNFIFLYLEFDAE